MPTLLDYVTETEQWADTPREGDDLDIEIAPDELAEGRVIESDGEYIVLAVSESAVTALEQRGMLSERIGRYGAVGSSRAMGYTVAEQELDPPSSATDKDPIDEDYMSRMLELAGITKAMAETAPIQPNPNAARTDPLAAKAADLAPVGTEQDPTTATTVDEGVMSGIDMDLRHIAKTGREDALIDALSGAFGDKTADYLQNMMREIEQELEARGQQSMIADQDRMMDIMMDRIQSQFDDEDEDFMESIMIGEAFDQRKADAYNRAVASGHSPEQAEKIAGIRDEDRNFYEIDVDGKMKRLAVRAATTPVQEAEYQGRKVPLGKPMRGDVKKFKVYVKDPKTGNVKKVNFGHGGKSAKRAGEKTLSIKKSNPARRRSFRARHNCDNPGPRTKARYWSCRAW